ncbi:hypothetical protein BGX26_002963 [Mortierella sp. AD094]|nr:hypothetical protein BGX26_002963 [Mortierella sp. AD094]
MSSIVPLAHQTVEINNDGSFFSSIWCEPRSYCFGGYNTTTNTNTTTYSGALLAGPYGPLTLVLSASYAEDLTKGYRQITGCMDGSVWSLDPKDVGGMIDSVVDPYTCLNAKKFVSFLAPNTNTYCIRCCNGTNADTDCDTTDPTQGCSKAIPGVYTMKDGSTCKPPVIPTKTGPNIVGIVSAMVFIAVMIVSVYSHRRGINRKRPPVISPRLRPAHDGYIEMMPQQQMIRLPQQPLQHYPTDDGDEQLPEYRP